MTEPSVQVPVSLIERIRDTYTGRDYMAADAAVNALLTLLSQPTPSGETWPEDDEEFCDRCFAGVDSPEHHAKCVETGFAEDGESASPSAPKWHQVRSIAHMVPGTTLTAGHPESGRPARFERCEDEQHAPHTLFDMVGGSFWKPSAIDPSTIRDVTPPSVTP